MLCFAQSIAGCDCGKLSGPRGDYEIFKNYIKFLTAQIPPVFLALRVTLAWHLSAFDSAATAIRIAVEAQGTLLSVQ